MVSEITPSLPGQQSRMRREDWLIVCFFFLVSFLDYFHWDSALVVEDLWSIGRIGMFVPLVM